MAELLPASQRKRCTLTDKEETGHQELVDVMCDQPGRTTLTEYKIEMGPALAVCLPPYHLPHAGPEGATGKCSRMISLKWCQL